MGELLLCKEPMVTVPYYIEGIGWNIYTLEELCYYVEHNIYLLERDFMTVELCNWILEEAKNKALAEKLYAIMQRRGQLFEFVFVLLTECGYSPKDTISDVTAVIRDMEKKTEFERNKMRADRLLEQEKYLSSIYEYRLLLASEDALEQNSILLGNIWHNLGTAYIRMFLFAEGIHCYEKAYQKNHSKASLRAYITACYCYYEETEVLQVVAPYQPEEELLEEVKQEVTQIHQTEACNRTEMYQKEVGELLFKWKEEYRKICRI